MGRYVQLPNKITKFPQWLNDWMADCGITLWGAADLRIFETPKDETGKGFPAAISWAVAMPPEIMAGIRNGPNRAYADAYARVNAILNDQSSRLAERIRTHGFRARALAASERTDRVNIKGDFPQKTAATRAGIGWVGRHCQLITRDYGSWVRLGTVFTDMSLPFGPALERSFCGSCSACVTACPAGALKGKAWKPGMPREAILDATVCDAWKKTHYAHLHNGHNCGICSAVCPYGLKQLRHTARRNSRTR